MNPEALLIMLFILLGINIFGVIILGCTINVLNSQVHTLAESICRTDRDVISNNTRLINLDKRLDNKLGDISKAVEKLMDIEHHKINLATRLKADLDKTWTTTPI